MEVWSRFLLHLRKLGFPAHPISFPNHLAGGYIHVAKKRAEKRHLPFRYCHDSSKQDMRK